MTRSLPRPFLGGVGLGAAGTLAWWYWLVLAIALILDLAGVPHALRFAVALAWVQVAHFRIREGTWVAFPVQVRGAYAVILSLGLIPWLHGIVWVPAIGTPAQVLIGYCALARLMSLLPWNRRHPLSADLIWRTFTSPPRAGNILQGQEAPRLGLSPRS